MGRSQTPALFFKGYSMSEGTKDNKQNEQSLSKFSLTAVLLLALVTVLLAALAVVVLKYTSAQRGVNASEQAGTRAATEAINYLKEQSFSSLNFPNQGIIFDNITFNDIFTSKNFANIVWDCNLSKTGYDLTFTAVPLSKSEFQPSELSVSFELPSGLNGGLSITHFSLSFSDGSHHSFGINDATPSDRYLSSIRTQNAFETYICTLFSELGNLPVESATSSSHKAFVL